MILEYLEKKPKVSWRNAMSTVDKTHKKGGVYGWRGVMVDGDLYLKREGGCVWKWSEELGKTQCHKALPEYWVIRDLRRYTRREIVWMLLKEGHEMERQLEDILIEACNAINK